MNRFKLALLVVLLTVNTGTVAQDDVLTITSWGGAYEAAQVQAYFKPFEEAHDIRIELKPYNGGVAPLNQLDSPGYGNWDVIDMVESDALTACEERLIAEFDHTVLDAAPDGTLPHKDFVSRSLTKCGVAHLSFATVLAYDDRAFPTEKPNSVADFFDIERFPGKRAIQRSPKGIMEWAMLSHNVPVRQIYDLLSTERGFRLVTHRLDEIRDHIVWWEKGHEPVQMLRDGKVVMASGFNGRFYAARTNQNIPISLIQDGQFLELSVWAIHRQARHHNLASQFIRFATRTERMAAFSNILPYGPTRNSAFERIGLHASANASIREHLPMSEFASNRKILADTEWYSWTEALRNQWFNDWLKSANQ